MKISAPLNYLRILMACLFSLSSLAVRAEPLTALTTQSAQPTIEEMRLRDRHNKPGDELAAWQEFAARILADRKSGAALRAETKAGLALAFYQADQPAKGFDQAEEAMQIVRAARLSSATFLAELHATRALLLGELKRFDEAQREAETSLTEARSRSGEDSKAGATAYESLSLVAYGRGDMAVARRFACRAADLAQAHVPPTNSMVASLLMTCGIFAYNLDDDDALTIMRKAADIAYANLPPDNTTVAQSLNGSGGALLQLGRFAEAESIFRRELDLERKLYGEESLNAYYPLPVLGRSLERQGKYEEAEAVFRTAVQIAHRIDVGGGLDLRGNSYVNLATVLERQNYYEEAKAALTTGLAELEVALPAGHTSILTAKQALARVLTIQGNVAEARPLIEAGVAGLIKAYGENHRVTLSAQFDRARMLDRAGDHSAAFAAAAEAGRRLEERQNDLTSRRKDMVSLSPVLTSSFSELALIALHNNRMAAAFRAAQMASNSELTLVNAELAASSLAQSKGLSSMVGQLRAEQSRLQGLQSALADVEGGASGNLILIRNDIKQSEARATDLLKQISLQFPDYASLSRPRPVSLSELQTFLKLDQAVIIPLNLQDRVATIAVTSSDMFWAEDSGSRTEVIGLVSRVRQSIDAARLEPDPSRAPFDAQAARALYVKLLPGKLADRLANKSEWLFPSAGLASNLPLALLLDASPRPNAKLSQYPWLIKRHAIAIISDFSFQGRSGSAIREPRFVGIGDPMLQGAEITLSRLPPLNRATLELRAMASAFTNSESKLIAGSVATEQAVRAFDFAPYSIVAFATHGLMNGEIAGLSEPALVLTPSTPLTVADDGLLTASEIAQLDIPADWVILSACNSGAGRNPTAPTYSGLARAFRTAGARSFLLSHWPVRDDAAAKLSVDTVKGAKTSASRAQALRKAMLKLMSDRSMKGRSHPAIWAPFVLLEN